MILRIVACLLAPLWLSEEDTNLQLRVEEIPLEASLFCFVRYFVYALVCLNWLGKKRKPAKGSAIGSNKTQVAIPWRAVMQIVQVNTNMHWQIKRV